MKDIDASMRSCIDILQEKKATDLMYLDIGHVQTFFEGFLIATANSQLHLSSLSRSISTHLEIKRIQRDEIESGWVCISYYPHAVHLFLAEQRVKYNFERLWGDGDVLRIQSAAVAE